MFVCFFQTKTTGFNPKQSDRKNVIAAPGHSQSNPLIDETVSNFEWNIWYNALIVCLLTETEIVILSQMWVAYFDSTPEAKPQQPNAIRNDAIRDLQNSPNCPIMKRCS